MEHIYSDRREYFKRDKNERCVFCVAQQKEDNFNNLIIHRGKDCFVILNLYPYSSGHIMVVPNEHTNRFEDLSPEVLSEMMMLVQKGLRVLTRAYCPQGFNVGLNIGDAGGAGIKEHMHIHVIPRWIGDANFITVIGKTRVMPESLEETYDRLREEWQADCEE